MTASRKRQAAVDVDSSRLTQALAERDAALLELARVRTELDAVRKALASLGEAEPPRYPARAGPEGAPLRYRVADEVNDRVKAVLAPLKAAVSKVRGGGEGT